MGGVNTPCYQHFVSRAPAHRPSRLFPPSRRSSTRPPPRPRHRYPRPLCSGSATPALARRIMTAGCELLYVCTARMFLPSASSGHQTDIVFTDPVVSHLYLTRSVLLAHLLRQSQPSTVPINTFLLLHSYNRTVLTVQIQ